MFQAKQHNICPLYKSIVYLSIGNHNISIYIYIIIICDNNCEIYWFLPGIRNKITECTAKKIGKFVSTGNVTFNL